MLRLRSRPPDVPALPAFDMTPMIDVTFQLIIFFMLVMDLSSAQNENLRQPTARHLLTGGIDPGELVVNVTGDGRLRVSGKTVSDEALESILESRRRTRPDAPVLIRADRSARFELIQKVMMMTQHVGGVSRLRFGAAMEVNR